MRNTPLIALCLAACSPPDTDAPLETDSDSPGAFGFYPWISGDKSLYGILAREDADSTAGFKSALCGRLIRQAWVTGEVVQSITPTAHF